jgi:16S rRNA (adenine1518-N6/adenine1519-N6)-dimethyltransferase
MSVAEIRDLLERYGLLARKDLGQNFLVEGGVAERLVALAGVAPGDCVLEIGTGLGQLTRALAARAERVVTLEIDSGLVRALEREGGLPPNVELIHADMLRCDLRALVAAAKPPVRVVANLPYSISGPALRRLLDLRDCVVSWSVMIQREVADRLFAVPGTKAYGSLTVLHRLTVELERAMDLSPRCFYPAPRVRSTFVVMTPHAESDLSSDELVEVERVVRAAFGSRRKTLANSLRGARVGPRGGGDVADVLERIGVDPRERAEQLTPERLLALARELAA